MFQIGLVGSSITLYYILSRYNAYRNYEYCWMSMESPDLKDISAQLDQVAKPLRVRGLNVETVVRVGIPADEIMKQAKAIDAIMVILGSHGHHCINASLFNPSVDILRSLNLMDGISDNRVDLGLT